MEPDKIAHLFAGWDETMIWSYLHGYMGTARTDNERHPLSAAVSVGDFCFFAGVPHTALVRKTTDAILVPRDSAWADLITAVWGTSVREHLRYATDKDPAVFDRQRLAAFAQALPEGFSLRPFDEMLHRQAMSAHWSRDLCSQFADWADFDRRGIGMAVVHDGRLTAGASSYTIYHGGIEIEIDTHPDFRRRQLATACGAALILACLQTNLYPSWDAHDLRSAALAKKLGYHITDAYRTFLRDI